MAILKNTENDSVKSGITSVFYMKSKRCAGLFTSDCYHRCIHFPLCVDDYKTEREAIKEYRKLRENYEDPCVACYDDCENCEIRKGMR